MKTVARFDHLDDAYSAMAVLESEGVRCFLPDEFTIGLYWPYCQALGGIRLQVCDEHVAEASDILKSAMVETLSPRCPSCGSSKLRVMRFGKWSALSIGIGFCPPGSQVRYHCCSCRKTIPVSEADHDSEAHERLAELALGKRFVDTRSDRWPRYLRFPIGAAVGALVLIVLLIVRALTVTEDFPLATGLLIAGFLGGFCNCLIGLADDLRERHVQPDGRSNAAEPSPELDRQ